MRTANSASYRRVSQPDLPNVGIGSSSRIVAAAYSLAPGATNIERKGDVHEIVSPDPLGNDRTNTAARVLFPAAGRQAQGAVIRDALVNDKEYCEALLLKIDHLLGQETVPAASRSTSATVASAAAAKELRSAA